MEPRLDAFNAVRRKWDPQGKIRSAAVACACWETSHERRAFWRHARHGAVVGAAAGRAAASGSSCWSTSRKNCSARRTTWKSAGPRTRSDRRLRSAPAGDVRRRARRGPEGLGSMQTVVVTAGLFAPQEELEQDPRRAARAADRRFHQYRAVLRGGAEAAARPAEGERSASSVPWPANGAANRWSSTARRRPACRATWKALDHKFRAQGLKVVCVKPGFVKTGMTWGLEAAAVCGRAGRRGPAGAAGHRSRLAGGLRAGGVALGDAGHSQPAADGDAEDQVLTTRTGRPSMMLANLVRLARPAHWIKKRLRSHSRAVSPWRPAAGWNCWPLVCGLLGFCLINSAAYTLNDVCDAAGDRLHPRKTTAVRWPPAP